MKTVSPKKFIQNVLVNEIGILKDTNPYLAFALMSIGVEFLGKCLNNFDDWNKSGRSKKDFELAINKLNSLKRYRPLLASHDLWDELRNGFAHSFIPKGKIALSSKLEDSHLHVKGKKINLRCEDFYNDFKGACIEVIKMKIFPSNKMTNPFMLIP